MTYIEGMYCSCMYNVHILNVQHTCIQYCTSNIHIMRCPHLKSGFAFSCFILLLYARTGCNGMPGVQYIYKHLIHSYIHIVYEIIFKQLV